MEKNIVGDDEPTWAFGLINEWQAQVSRDPFFVEILLIYFRK